MESDSLDSLRKAYDEDRLSNYSLVVILAPPPLPPPPRSILILPPGKLLPLMWVSLQMGLEEMLGLLMVMQIVSWKMENKWRKMALLRNLLRRVITTLFLMLKRLLSLLRGKGEGPS
ncbi:hypothetical protein SUGI_0928630 [Cryptomeria japonica]|nr:hypothetical protein SUGI_0928630 [Cryptomeria japonica]